MSKYIDVEKLIAEIERLKGIYPSWQLKLAMDDLHNFITSLQQERPEVDLEKEIDKEWEKCNPIDEGMGVESAYIHIEAFDIIAHHFYELGLNARKEK